MTSEIITAADSVIANFAEQAPDDAAHEDERDEHRDERNADRCAR